jgi:hypothetical protein
MKGSEGCPAVKADDGVAQAKSGETAGELRSPRPPQGGRPRKGVLVGRSMSRGSEERRRGPWCLLCRSDSRVGEKKGGKGGPIRHITWRRRREPAMRSEEGVGGLAAGNARGRWEGGSDSAHHVEEEEGGGHAE